MGEEWLQCAEKENIQRTHWRRRKQPKAWGEWYGQHRRNGIDKYSLSHLLTIHPTGMAGDSVEALTSLWYWEGEWTIDMVAARRPTPGG